LTVGESSLPRKASIIISTLGLINALECLGAGLYLYYYSIRAQPAIIGFYLILDGLVMLAGAYSLYSSHYFIGGLLVLAPGLVFGYIAWIVLFESIRIGGSFGLPDEIWWVLAFTIPITISAAAFLMHIERWRTRRARAFNEIDIPSENATPDSVLLKRRSRDITFNARAH
jgi:hypothetical protein